MFNYDVLRMHVVDSKTFWTSWLVGANIVTDDLHFQYMYEYKVKVSNLSRNDSVFLSYFLKDRELERIHSGISILCLKIYH